MLIHHLSKERITNPVVARLEWATTGDRKVKIRTNLPAVP